MAPRNFLSIEILYRGLAAQIAKSTGTELPIVKSIMRRMYLAVGMHWHRAIRPRHFRAGAAARYGYMPRKRLYRKIKRQEVGHARDLVHSGRSERATEDVHYKTTPRGVKVVMQGGNITRGRQLMERKVISGMGFGATLKRQRRVFPSQMETELTTVTDAENVELGKIADREATQLFNRMGGSHRVSI